MPEFGFFRLLNGKRTIGRQVFLFGLFAKEGNDNVFRSRIEV